MIGCPVAAKMKPPSALSQALDAACTAWLGRRVDAVAHGLHRFLSTVSDARVTLPNLNNVTVRIANVAARLTIFWLWLRDELRSPTSPKCIALLNIGDANVHEAAEVIGISRYAKRDRRLVGRRPASD